MKNDLVTVLFLNKKLEIKNKNVNEPLIKELKLPSVLTRASELNDFIDLLSFDREVTQNLLFIAIGIGDYYTTNSSYFFEGKSQNLQMECFPNYENGKVDGIVIFFKVIKKQDSIESIVQDINQFFINNDQIFRGQFNQFAIEKLCKLAQCELGIIGECQSTSDGVAYFKIQSYFVADNYKSFFSKFDNMSVELHNTGSVFWQVNNQLSVLISNDLKKDKLSVGVPLGHPDITNFLGIPIINNDQTVSILALANRKNDFDYHFVNEIRSFIVAFAQLQNKIIEHDHNTNIIKKYDLISQASDLGIWEWNLVNDLVTFDKKFMEMLGIEKNKSSIIFNNFKAYLHKDDVDAFSKNVLNYLYGKTDNFEMKIRLRKFNDEYIPILCKGKITERNIKSGEPQVFTATNFNISNIQKMEEEIAHHQKAAIQNAKLASIGELAAGVGHEINNPLAIILGNLERIEREFKSLGITNEKISKSINTQYVAIDRISKIVSGLRVLARDDKGSIKAVDISDVIDQLIFMLTELYEKDQVTIRYNKNVGNVFIKAEVGKFHQVLVNLISNAKDAIESMKERLIDVDVLIQDNFLVIKIRDYGPGIPDDIKEKVFDAFFTTKEVGKGTGIGLSVVASLVDEMDGIIEFTSEPGQGTEFILKFPTTGRDSVEISKPAHFKIDNSNKYKGKKALLVEDEEEMRFMIKEVLELLGFIVCDFDNPLPAIEYINKNDVDLVLTDVKMPNMDGVTMIDKIKKIKNNNKIIYLIMTGGVGTNIMEKIETSVQGDSCDGYIFKPFSSKEIGETVGKLM